MAFRTTPNLGAQFDQKGPYYWDEGAGIPSGDPSYRLGNVELGSDGHDYIHVKAAGTLAASARVTVDEVTFVATAGGSGPWMVPADLEGGVVADQVFQARRFTL